MIEDYLSNMRAGGSPDTSIRVRRAQLARAFRTIGKPPELVTLDDLIGYLSAQDWKPETRKAVRSALRGFFAWAVATGRVESSPAERLPRVTVPQGQPRPAPEDVLDHALAAAGPRDRLMLMLAAYAGLRRAEIARVHSDHLAGHRLRVTGKGGKTRIVPLHPLLAEALATVNGFAFPGQIDGHLSPDWVGRRLKHLLGDNYSAHTLRHRFASRAYGNNRDILKVRDWLGHSSIATTQRYTATPADDDLEAIKGIA